jgi:uncharacterized protein (TIGR00255 family)
MILSMTGYGVGSAQKDDVSVSVEIRTVNHRFLDLHIRLPREFLFLEGDIQKSIRKALDRGRVEVTVSIQHTGPTEFAVNHNLANGYIEAVHQLNEKYGLVGTLDMQTMLGLPGILQNQDTFPEDMGETLSGLVDTGVQMALEGVLNMRRKEGESLRSDMLRNLGSIEKTAARIETLSEHSASDALRKLQDRIAQLLPPEQNDIDPQRLAQEAALLADKSDISEEITRLKSHLDQYRTLTDAEEKVGKKLDFLLQELHREANTILSKTSSLEVSNFAISIKTDIEKLREQVQNVE